MSSLRSRRGPRSPRRRRPPPPRGPGLAGRAPHPDRAPAGRGRLRGAALGPALRARCRPAHPADDRRGAAPGRCAPPGQPHRHRLGRTHPHVRRHRGAEGTLALAAPQRRGVLVPALLRAGRRLGPGRAARRGPSATATTRSSTGRRSGRATPTSPGGASCSPAPTPPPPSTSASATSSAHGRARASRSGPSST